MENSNFEFITENRITCSRAYTKLVLCIINKKKNIIIKCKKKNKLFK